MTGFRREWVRTIPLGLLDIGLHAAAAWWLPGPWWLQYLPDTAVPVLWLRSALTDERAPDHSWVLHVHRLLHAKPRYRALSVSLWCALGVLLALTIGVHPLLLPVNVVVHVAIDEMTHGEGWQ